MNSTPKIDRVIKYLVEGNTLTSKQAKARFGVKNMRALVSDIRQERGIPVFRNYRKDSRGQKVAYYRAASSAPPYVVAAGFRALAAQRRAA